MVPVSQTAKQRRLLRLEAYDGHQKAEGRCEAPKAVDGAKPRFARTSRGKRVDRYIGTIADGCLVLAEEAPNPTSISTHLPLTNERRTTYRRRHHSRIVVAVSRRHSGLSAVFTPARTAGIVSTVHLARKGIKVQGRPESPEITSHGAKPILFVGRRLFGQRDSHTQVLIIHRQVNALVLGCAVRVEPRGIVVKLAVTARHRRDLYCEATADPSTKPATSARFIKTRKVAGHFATPTINRATTPRIIDKKVTNETNLSSAGRRLSHPVMCLFYKLCIAKKLAKFRRTFTQTTKRNTTRWSTGGMRIIPSDF